MLDAPDEWRGLTATEIARLVLHSLSATRREQHLASLLHEALEERDDAQEELARRKGA